jgi:branched-chain amino acid transport system substrate-binding protein
MDRHQAQPEGGVDGPCAQAEQEEQQAIVDPGRVGASCDHGAMRVPLRPLAVAGLVALVAAGSVACGRSGDGGGDPIPVGMINMEDAPVGSFPELRRGAEAAVTYVNEELDGVRNRHLRLEVCRSQGTPESSQACATSLRAKNPVAVLGGIDLGAGAALNVFERARIPYVGLTPSLGEELTSDTAFMLAGGAAADLLGQAEYITGTLQAKKVSILHLDLPGVLQTAVLAARIVLEKRGVEDVRIVSEKADAADFVPALRSATAGNPDVLVAVFPAQGCARILAGAQALRVRTKLFFPSACAAQQVFEAAGPAAEGAYFAAGLIPYVDRGHPDVAT